MGINHINAANVTMHSYGRRVLRDIPKHTLEVNHFSVINVAMPLLDRTVSKDISQHTIKINHFSVANVTRPSHILPILKVI